MQASVSQWLENNWQLTKSACWLGEAADSKLNLSLMKKDTFLAGGGIWLVPSHWKERAVPSCSVSHIAPTVLPAELFIRGFLLTQVSQVLGLLIYLVLMWAGAFWRWGGSLPQNLTSFPTTKIPSGMCRICCVDPHRPFWKWEVGVKLHLQRKIRERT